VLGTEGESAGVLTRRQLLDAAAGQSAGRTIGRITRKPRTVVFADQTLREVANAFAVHGITRAPEVDRHDPTRPG